LSRSEWKQEQAEAQRIAATLARNEKAEETLRSRFDEVVKREKAVEEIEKLNSKTMGAFIKSQFRELNDDQINHCWAVLKTKADEFRATPKQVISESQELKKGKKI
jgi:hypothetical protein